MILHAKIVTVTRELSLGQRFGKEVGRIELGADVTNANGEIPDVVSCDEREWRDPGCSLGS